jgi:hypothetical protein
MGVEIFDLISQASRHRGTFKWLGTTAGTFEDLVSIMADNGEDDHS